jgi:hypothetical protein
MSGLNGRPFTVPNVAAQFVINIGKDSYANPLGWRYGVEQPGQVLLHELTHVWQLNNSSFLPGLLCDMIGTQIAYTLGSDVYDPKGGTKPFSSYNPEAQARIFDLWVNRGMHTHDPFFRFVEGNIWARNAGVNAQSRAEQNWRWCKKCGALAYTGSSGSDHCPAGGAHSSANSFNYAVTSNLDPAKANWWNIWAMDGGWARCQKCQGLFAASEGEGVCPVHPAVGPGHGVQKQGRGHSAANGSTYFLQWSSISSWWPPDAGTGQNGWSMCSLCLGLFFQSGTNVCPATDNKKGAHQPSGTPFVLYPWPEPASVSSDRQ